MCLLVFLRSYEILVPRVLYVADHAVCPMVIVCLILLRLFGGYVREENQSDCLESQLKMCALRLRYYIFK